jgi:hypothetical protein
MTHALGFITLGSRGL